MPSTYLAYFNIHEPCDRPQVVCDATTGAIYRPMWTVNADTRPVTTCPHTRYHGPYEKIIHFSTNTHPEDKYYIKSAREIHLQMRLLNLSDAERANVSRAYKNFYSKELSEESRPTPQFTTAAAPVPVPEKKPDPSYYYGKPLQKQPFKIQ